MRLIILGDGPERPHLDALVNDLGIAPDVQLRGHERNPLPYFRRANLFVLPSRWEGLSNALLEALASGTPVVSSRCSGSVELLDSGRYGSLVDVGEIHGLANIIIDTLATEKPGIEQRKRAQDYDLATTLAA